MIHIDLQSLASKKLSKDLCDLVTRQVGQLLLEELDRKIRNCEDNETVCLDFSGIGVIDYSCADEIICNLVARFISNEYGDKFLLLENVKETQKENIAVALERRRLVVLALLRNSKTWQIIGMLNNYLLKTLEIIMKEKSISSSELAKRLKIRLNTASTRLVNLYKLKLVKRVSQKKSNRGRGSFVYNSILNG